jgi:hypothetical protein
MLFAERVVNLVLKLNVRANFAGAARRPVHFHNPTILVIVPSGTARPTDFVVIRKK